MIITIEQVRIRKVDDLCVVVEVPREKTYKDAKTGELKERAEKDCWMIHGYYGNVKSALRGMYRDDLLIVDKDMTLEEYLDRNEIARKALIDATKRLYED